MVDPQARIKSGRTCLVIQKKRCGLTNDSSKRRQSNIESSIYRRLYTSIQQEMILFNDVTRIRRHSSHRRSRHRHRMLRCLRYWRHAPTPRCPSKYLHVLWHDQPTRLGLEECSLCLRLHFLRSLRGTGYRLRCCFPSFAPPFPPVAGLLETSVPNFASARSEYRVRRALDRRY